MRDQFGHHPSPLQDSGLPPRKVDDCPTQSFCCPPTNYLLPRKVDCCTHTCSSVQQWFLESSIPSTPCSEWHTYYWKWRISMVQIGSKVLQFVFNQMASKETLITVSLNWFWRLSTFPSHRRAMITFSELMKEQKEHRGGGPVTMLPWTPSLVSLLRALSQIS